MLTGCGARRDNGRRFLPPVRCPPVQQPGRERPRRPRARLSRRAFWGRSRPGCSVSDFVENPVKFCSRSRSGSGGKCRPLGDRLGLSPLRDQLWLARRLEHGVPTGRRHGCHVAADNPDDADAIGQERSKNESCRHHCRPCTSWEAECQPSLRISLCGSAWARQDSPRCARRFAVLTRPARSRRSSIYRSDGSHRDPLKQCDSAFRPPSNRNSRRPP